MARSGTKGYDIIPRGTAKILSDNTNKKRIRYILCHRRKKYGESLGSGKIVPGLRPCNYSFRYGTLRSGTLGLIQDPDLVGPDQDINLSNSIWIFLPVFWKFDFSRITTRNCSL